MFDNVLELAGQCGGPDSKEMLLKRAKDEYKTGNIVHSVFYQVIAMCLVFQMRFKAYFDDECVIDRSYLDTLTEDLENKIAKNPLLKYSMECDKKISQEKKIIQPPIPELDDLLQYATMPENGVHALLNRCSELPEEWTIIHLCKEHQNDTTIQTFSKIQQSASPVYLAILKHCRSNEYPKPICIRLTNSNQEKMFYQFSKMTDYFKHYTAFHGTDVNKREDRVQYWQGLHALEQHVADAIEDLKNFVGVWFFLFSGSLQRRGNGAEHHQKAIFQKVDEFCDNHGLQDDQRVILSLCAMQCQTMKNTDLWKLSEELMSSKKVSELTYTFLTKLNSSHPLSSPSFNPCIAIIDERIDHFCWERVNPERSLCRVSSMHLLLQLYHRYKHQIEKGYLVINTINGNCVVNPENNLQQMEDRMKTFFSHWLPNWQCTYKTVPSVDYLKKTFTESKCYVYCGHGSGLQYISGKHISKLQIKCVVFLFGCDSVRLRSHGLYSEMTGSHLYYHAALCPAVVGIMHPGLDFPMDRLSTYILSHWIKSEKAKTFHWSDVNKVIWKKLNIVQPRDSELNGSSSSFNKAKCAESSNSKTPLKSIDSRAKQDIKDCSSDCDISLHCTGSLPQIICSIHRNTQEKLYNTIGYVYRGLPVWNCNVQKLYGDDE